MNILSRVPMPQHQAQQNFNKPQGIVRKFDHEPD